MLPVRRSKRFYQLLNPANISRHTHAYPPRPGAGAVVLSFQFRFFRRVHRDGLVRIPQPGAGRGLQPLLGELVAAVLQLIPGPKPGANCECTALTHSLTHSHANRHPRP